MITAVLIDDQQECIEDLLYLFKKHEIPVEVVSTANSGKDGLVAILKHRPQLVFLDVVMPGMSGFEMLELIPKFEFHLIITTSADKYAIQAIRASALDFLLKPVKLKELQDAISRSIEKKELPNKIQLDFLAESLSHRDHSIKKLALTVSDGVLLENVADILYFESDGNYTTVYLKGDKKILVSKPIGKFEDMVDPKVFFRIHNSYLVNLNYISKFVRSDGGHIVLENGKTITVSRSRKEAFLEVLGKI